MLAPISEKIEAIRRQPEQIRIRYVWGCVAFSMAAIFILWIFSIASMFAGNKAKTDKTSAVSVESMNEQLKTLNEQAPSLKDLDNQSLETMNEDILSKYQEQFPADTDNNNNLSNEAESSAYSDLPSDNFPQ